MQAITPAALKLLALFLAAQTLIIFSGYLMFAMIGDINRKVSQENQISYWGGTFDKFRKVLVEHRKLYPGRHLATYFKICVFAGMALFALFAWSIGIFGGN